MSEPPRDWLEFWVRFVCAFVVFGLVLGIIMLRYLEWLTPVQLGLVWGLSTLLTSLIAACVGDAFWHEAFSHFRWWP